MMPNAFNNVHAEQELNFAFNRVREMLYAEDSGALPPPFNLLSIPYMGVQAGSLLATGRTDSFVPPSLCLEAAERRDSRDDELGDGPDESVITEVFLKLPVSHRLDRLLPLR